MLRNLYFPPGCGKFFNPAGTFGTRPLYCSGISWKLWGAGELSDGAWHRVAGADEVEPEEPKRVLIGDEEVALFNIDGSIFATSNICTHAFASLCDGFQEGEEIECPLHEGRFNIKTGKAMCAPVTDDLDSFEVKVEDGDVFVKV